MPHPTLAPAERPIADLNTTPLIDVMLVLLIMFIVTIPVQTHAVKIEMPVCSACMPPLNPLKNEVAIGATDAVTWNGEAVDDARLAALLAASVAHDPQPELRLRPDPNARYDTVDRVLTIIKRAHVTQLGFVGNERYATEF